MVPEQALPDISNVARDTARLKTRRQGKSVQPGSARLVQVGLDVPVCIPDGHAVRAESGQGTAEDDAAIGEVAAQIRREHPRWVVIWVARKREYQAWPLFRAPRETVAAAATAAGLIQQMEQIERAAGSGRRSSPPPPTPSENTT